MRGLSGSGVLEAWEAGQGQHPLDRALSVLCAGYPEMDRGALADLSIGQRDSLLLALRAGTFGDSMVGFAACGRCGERLELAMPASAFATPASEPEGEVGFGAEGAVRRPGAPIGEVGFGAEGAVRRPGAPIGELEIEGVRIRFRLPTSRDLAAIAGIADPQAARRELVARCVLEGPPGGALPDEVAARLAERMAEMDPAADLVLELSCPACGHAWTALLDVERFFWTELAAQARRLLSEVHTLARAYGWDEARILGMGAVRRQAYLEMVGA